jgi:hypothetical protein
MIQCEVVRSNTGWLTSRKPSLQVTWNFNWTSMKLLNTAQELGEESDKSRDYWIIHQHHCSCAGVTDPPIPRFCRITMNSPLRVSMGLSSHRQVSGVAIGITSHGRTLCTCCTYQGTIEMVCWVGESSCILMRYLCLDISGDMVGWAQIKAVRPATVYWRQTENWITENLGQMPNIVHIWEGLAATTCLIPCE